MHYAISYQAQSHEYLTTTPRRHTIKHGLLRVTQGFVFIRLGKKEYVVEPGDTFWLPFDTLAAVTYTPNTQLDRIEVSVRTQLPLVRQAGYIQPTPLLTALLDRLSTVDDRQKQLPLLTVVRDELPSITPKLSESTFTKQLNQWLSDKTLRAQSSLPSEVQLLLRVREARKQMLSGQARSQVIKQWFDGNDAVFDNLEQALVG
ncbi:AraC family transcriptional regulator [Vibrio cholerae]